MKQFVPVTDELIDQPNIPSHWQLVPYQVDHPCFRWSVCNEPGMDTPDSQTNRLLRASRRALARRPGSPQGAGPSQR